VLKLARVRNFFVGLPILWVVLALPPVMAQAPGDLILLQKIEALEKQVQQLSNQLDTQARELRDFKQEQQGRNVSYDTQFEQLAKGSASSSRALETTQAPKEDRGSTSQTSEREAYQEALNRLMKREFAVAQAAWEAFINSYPQSSLLSNALYWQGETLLAQDKAQEALALFDRAILQDPKNPKARDALLKKGYALLALKRPQEAKLVLEQVVAQHPDSSAARLAQQKLSGL